MAAASWSVEPFIREQWARGDVADSWKAAPTLSPWWKMSCLKASSSSARFHTPVCCLYSGGDALQHKQQHRQMRQKHFKAGPASFTRVYPTRDFSAQERDDWDGVSPWKENPLGVTMYAVITLTLGVAWAEVGLRRHSCFQSCLGVCVWPALGCAILG